MISKFNLIFFILIVVLGTFLFWRVIMSLNSRKNIPVPGNPGDQSPVPKNDRVNGAYIGIVFIANILFYALQIFFTQSAPNLFATQIGLNVAAAVFCLMTGRNALGRTFLLSIVWIFLIGPVFLAALCFAPALCQH